MRRYGLAAMLILWAGAAWADPSSYPILASQRYFAFAGATALILLIETPLLVWIAGWRWGPALGGVVVANLVSAAAGGMYFGTAWPDLLPLLAIAVVVELVILGSLSIALSTRATRYPSARLVVAAALMNVATCWVGPALSPSPNHFEEDRKKLCMSRLKGVALATIMYAQDHDDMLPVARTAAELRAAVDPYTRSNGPRGRDWFHCPGIASRWQLLPTSRDEDSYILFPNLPKRLSDAEHAEHLGQYLMVGDDAPRHSGWRVVAMLDTRVTGFPEPSIPENILHNGEREPTKGDAQRPR